MSITGSILSIVIWFQAAECFFFWIIYGSVQTMRSNTIRTWALSIPRSRRIGIAATIMLGSIVQIFVVLVTCLNHNGFGPMGMTPITWLLVNIFGLLFVHGQTMATSLVLASIHESVTEGRVQASTTHSSQENDQK